MHLLPSPSAISSDTTHRSDASSFLEAAGRFTSHNQHFAHHFDELKQAPSDPESMIKKDTNIDMSSRESIEDVEWNDETRVLPPEGSETPFSMQNAAVIVSLGHAKNAPNDRQAFSQVDVAEIDHKNAQPFPLNDKSMNSHSHLNSSNIGMATVSVRTFDAGVSSADPMLGAQMIGNKHRPLARELGHVNEIELNTTTLTETAKTYAIEKQSHTTLTAPKQDHTSEKNGAVTALKFDKFHTVDDDFNPSHISENNPPRHTISDPARLTNSSTVMPVAFQSTMIQTESSGIDLPFDQDPNAPFQASAANQPMNHAPQVITVKPVPAANFSAIADPLVTLSDTGGQIDVTLSPEELGKLSIKLEQSSQGTVFTFSAERAETQEMIRRQLEQLQEQFQSFGFENARFAFGEQSSNGGADHSNPTDAEMTTSQNTEADTLLRTYQFAPQASLDIRM